MGVLHKEFAENRRILSFVNNLIRDENKQDFAALSADEVAMLAGLFFDAWPEFAAESLVEGDTEDLHRAIVSNLSGLNSGHTIAQAVRRKVVKYYLDQMEDLYAEQVSNYKCDVTAAKMDSEA